ncbi:progestin and adipoQ receptor family member 3-like [Dermacentor variabilis]|uniref:progestin and adipoQ receptor family member 3-like n=1 Tax=Dermacentor variabilis TaxID=34621 RepID=UPI003F5B56A5
MDATVDYEPQQPRPAAAHRPRDRPGKRRDHHAKLRRFEEVPAFLRPNPFIRRGYRVLYTPRQCLRSVFQWNNETLNIWTHLGGIFLFGAVLVRDVRYRLPSVRANLVDSAVVVAIVCAYITTLSLSVLYHTFNCQSKEAYHKLLRYDLAGVGLSLGSTFSSGVILAFQEHAFFMYLYVSLETLLLVFIMATQDSDNSKVLCSLVVFGLVPTFHWLYLAPPYMPLILPRVALIFVYAAISYVVLEGRFPERMWPGRCDYVGASHQIWHLLVLLMTYWWHETAFEFVRCKNGLC